MLDCFQRMRRSVSIVSFGETILIGCGAASISLPDAPVADRSSRGSCVGATRAQTDPQKRLILCLVLNHAIMEEELTQRYGLVVLTDMKHVKLMSLDLKLIRMVSKRAKQSTCCDSCAASAFLSVIFDVVKNWLPDIVKKSVFFHRGSREKVLARLKSFRITEKELPK